MLSSGILRKTAIITLGIFLWFSLGSSFIWGRQGQEDAVVKARQLLRNGDYEGAIKLVEDYIAKIRVIAEQKKNIAEAYYIIAKIYFIVGEDQDSEANLRRVFETFPAFSIDEPDLTFRDRVNRVKEVVSAEQKANIEEKPVVKEKTPEKEQSVAIGKAGEAKKRKFPWLIAAGVAVAGGALAVLLLNKKSSASPQFGSIPIISDPSGAKVYLDNADTGQTTDCTLNNIAAGTHTLKIELVNYGKWERNVEVKGGQTANVNATLAGFKYEFVTKWGSFGSGDGQFKEPTGVAVDTQGNILVVEHQNHRVQRFSPSGTFLYKWGSYGTGNGQFFFPLAVAVDYSNNVYVSEEGNCVKKFTPGGFFVTKWGTLGSGDGQFNSPVGIAVDIKNGDVVFVSDFSNYRIQKFTSSGVFLAKWGSYGSGDGQFSGPTGIAVDSPGNVYVVDGYNHRIQKFNSSGTFLAKWGSQGSGDGQFKNPAGVATDSWGNVYVADANNRRIQKFTSNGTFMTKWGNEGAGDGQFGSPAGIAVDYLGYVYVSDIQNQCIQKIQMTNQVALSVTITYSPQNSSSKFYPFMKNPVLKSQSSDGQLFKRSKSTPDPPSRENRQAQKTKDQEYR